MDLRRGLLQLDLDMVLASPGNASELRLLVHVIDKTDWESVDPKNSSRGSGSWEDRSPGKADDCGDFIWYNPWTHKQISADEARTERDKERVIPQGHRMGYRYSSEPDVSGLYLDLALEQNDPQEGEEGRLSAMEGVTTSVPTSATQSGDVPLSFSGSGMTWLQNSANNSGGPSKLGFLSSFLREAGLDIDADVRDLSSLREAVSRQIGSSSTAGPSRPTQPDKQGEGRR